MPLAGGLFHFKKDSRIYSIKPADYDSKPLFSATDPDNRMLNEFFLYVLEDLHTGQSLGSLKFNNNDPECVKAAVDKVYPAIPGTPTAAERPATKAFSRELISYVSAFLPVAPYFKATDTRIACLCDDQYAETLSTLKQVNDKRFSEYMIRKTQAWFQRWAPPRRSSDAPANSAAGGGGGGGGGRVSAGTPGLKERPKLALSDDDEASGQVPSGTGPMTAADGRTSSSASSQDSNTEA